MGNSLNKLDFSRSRRIDCTEDVSSHPDSEKRAARMKEKADAHATAQQQ